MVTILFLSLIAAVIAERKKRQQNVISMVRALKGDVWNVNFSEGGRVLPPRNEWVPSIAYWLIPESRNYIYLCGDTIGDKEVAIAMSLPNLQGLNISKSRVTDQGLIKLSGCTNLKELQLYRVTTLSDTAIANFKKANPRCDVLR